MNGRNIQNRSSTVRDNSQWVQSVNTISCNIYGFSLLEWKSIGAKHAVTYQYFLQIVVPAFTTTSWPVQVFIIGTDYHFPTKAFRANDFVASIEVFDEIDIGTSKVVDHRRFFCLI